METRATEHIIPNIRPDWVRDDQACYIIEEFRTVHPDYGPIYSPLVPDYSNPNPTTFLDKSRGIAFADQFAQLNDRPARVVWQRDPLSIEDSSVVYTTTNGEAGTGILDGDKLRSTRHALGLTQAELATRLGVTGNTIARWERGELRIENPRMLWLAMERLRYPWG